MIQSRTTVLRDLHAHVQTGMIPGHIRAISGRNWAIPYDLAVVLSPQSGLVVGFFQIRKHKLQVGLAIVQMPDHGPG